MSQALRNLKPEASQSISILPRQTKEQHAGLRHRLRSAWCGRISGCQLGKPLEVLSMQQGRGAVLDYLKAASALPLRNYVPLIEASFAEEFGGSCLQNLERSEADDDINYSVLALMMLEKHGAQLKTLDVARTWLMYLPLAKTWTAERAALTTMALYMNETFAHGDEPGFDLKECSNNEYNDYIGAQIRADLYGWVYPGQPSQAAALARQDAQLSHRGEGIFGATFVAALGAAIPSTTSLEEAIDIALQEIPSTSHCAQAIQFARSVVGKPDAVSTLHLRYGHLSAVHTVNNLALVVWALLNYQDDFSAAIGEVVCAGWDTDCNGATVGGLWGLQAKTIPTHWSQPWQGRVATDLAGVGELCLDDLVERTVRLVPHLSGS